MHTFRFNGIDRQGQAQSGALVAADEQDLELRLRARGLWLLDARRERDQGGKRRRSPRLTRRELIQFCTLMAFQARAGIPLLQALEVTAQDSGSRRFSDLVNGLRERVESGTGFGGALAEHPRAFPPDLVQLVRAGEESGALPEVLEQARENLEWQERVAAEVKQATTYPAVVLAAAGILVLILFTFVVPKFVSLLSAAKVPLPAPTQAVFAVSSLARDHGLILLVAAGVAAAGLTILRRCSPRAERWFDQVRLSVPVIGPLIQLVVITRFAHNLALLYRNGVALPSALELVSGVTGSPLAAGAIRSVRQQVLEGHCLSDALRRQTAFPGLLVRLVVVGERTGQLDTSLEQLAAYYQEQLPRRLKRLLSLLEPVLILGLVGVVGVVALAVILPVLSLMQSLR